MGTPVLIGLRNIAIRAARWTAAFQPWPHHYVKPTAFAFNAFRSYHRLGGASTKLPAKLDDMMISRKEPDAKSSPNESSGGNGGRPEPNKKTKKRKTKSTDDEPKRLQPNVFVAIQIDDPVILQRIAKVQQQIVEAVPSVKRYIEPSRKLHLTLSVARIEDECLETLPEDALQDAVRTCIREAFCDSLGNASLELHGLGHFDRCRVIYAKVVPLRVDLVMLCRGFNTIFRQRLCPVYSSDIFTGHVTLFKARGRLNERAKVQQVYQQLAKEEGYFGVQPIKAIQILEMGRQDSSGYYYKLAEYETLKSEEAVRIQTLTDNAGVESTSDSPRLLLREMLAKAKFALLDAAVRDLEARKKKVRETVHSLATYYSKLFKAKQLKQQQLQQQQQQVPQTKSDILPSISDDGPPKPT